MRGKFLEVSRVRPLHLGGNLGNTSRTRLLPWFNVLAHREPEKTSVSAEVFSFLNMRLRWIHEDRQAQQG